jgi:nitrous oxidase accessory protein NosD
MIFCEVQYNDPSNNTGTVEWPQGQLPLLVDSLFDSVFSNTPTMFGSKMFGEGSLNNLRICADYIDTIVRIPESYPSAMGSNNLYFARLAASIAQNQQPGGLSTVQGSVLSDFDSWDLDSLIYKAGKTKINSANGQYDHIMVLPRNWKTGKKSSANFVRMLTPITLYGSHTDSYSVMLNHRDVNLISHELGHLLFGGNNFHATGGHDNLGDNSYFIATQGGWGIMGNGATSLQCVNAWERRRLGWKHANKDSLISAGEGLSEVHTDLDAAQYTDTGTYELRDFVTTGDAMRIKLPYIPDSEWPQWLWIENHQGISDLDNHIQLGCQDPFEQGLYVYVQCAKEKISGTESELFTNELADHIKPLAASGMHNVSLADTLVIDSCSGGFKPYRSWKNRTDNPLSGYSDLQAVDYDSDNNDSIFFGEREINFGERIGVNNTLSETWASRGHSRHGFRLGAQENSHIGIGTNPSTASHVTLVSNDTVVEESQLNLGYVNNRIIRLNGISIEILSYNSSTKAYTVRVKFDEIRLKENARWAADHIYLPNMADDYSELTAAGWSLIVDSDAQLRIERNLMPTRITNPEPNVTLLSENHNLFNDSTLFTMEAGADILVEENGGIILDNGSTMILGEGNELNLNYADMDVRNGSTLQLDSGAYLNLSGDYGELLIDSTSRLVINKGAQINLEGSESHITIYGAVVIGPHGVLGHTGDGYWALTGVIDNDPTATWKLDGRDTSDLELSLATSQTWVGNVDFSVCKIEYLANDVSLTVVNGEIEAENVLFDSWGQNGSQDDTALVARNSDLIIDGSYFEEFFCGIAAFDYNDDQEIKNSFFHDNLVSVYGDDLHHLDITNCEIEGFDNIPSGPMPDTFRGVHVERSEILRLNKSEVSHTGFGVIVNEVDGFYMRSGDIFDCDYGITSEYSLVFLRSGAEVHDNIYYGVGMLAEDPLASMITMGDSGCAGIYSNQVGIAGMGTTLNIDAYVHSGTGSSHVQFNRMDDNSHRNIVMCYDNAPGVFIPDADAEGVFWDDNGTQGIAPSSGKFAVISTASFFPSNWSCGVAQNVIAVNVANHCTCIPTTPCSCTSGTPPGGAGSYDGITHKTSEDASIVSRQIAETITQIVTQEIEREFFSKYSPFIQEDNQKNRNALSGIASIGLSRVDDEWIGVHHSGETIPLSKESLQRVVVAKVLTKGSVTPVALKETEDPYISIIQKMHLEESKTAFALYPNPTSGSVVLEISGKEEFEITAMLINARSQTVWSSAIKTGKTEIDLSTIDAGVYFLQVLDSKNELIGTEKLVVSE